MKTFSYVKLNIVLKSYYVKKKSVFIKKLNVEIWINSTSIYASMFDQGEKSISFEKRSLQKAFRNNPLAFSLEKIFERLRNLTKNNPESKKYGDEFLKDTKEQRLESFRFFTLCFLRWGKLDGCFIREKCGSLINYDLACPIPATIQKDPPLFPIVGCSSFFAIRFPFLLLFV